VGGHGPGSGIEEGRGGDAVTAGGQADPRDVRRITIKAQPFFGDADGPDLVIDRADVGTPLPDCPRWAYYQCVTIFATQKEAVACCVEPRMIATGGSAGG
jgi:hypothetical protein